MSDLEEVSDNELMDKISDETMKLSKKKNDDDESEGEEEEVETIKVKKTAGAEESEEDTEAEESDTEVEESEAEEESETAEPGAEPGAASDTEKTKLSFLPSSDEEEEDDEEEDEDYLQKFDKDIREDFVSTYHPESKTHNYEEINALSRVTRNSSGIVSDVLHKTLPFLTKYEITRILGQRARQINAGAKTFVVVPPNIIDGYLIAKMELEQKKMPFIIKRPLPNGCFEYWNVSDLELI